ncbi:MAG: 23S rRNA (adenine(2030)-N(6))-methyltransferase RlmJ [Alphaproteobacteria bacterium]|nr:23S rRNA (adenine(2030)-N(6))-methyltransferase RlmJ [Alphaproteobacteria bacterium]
MHKHAAFCRALARLVRGPDPVWVCETHAGRGLYDLSGAEARKTGEAAEGWLAVARDRAALATLPGPYVRAVRGLNGGALAPLYPGSPLLAAAILRPQDRLQLFELHRNEYPALADLMRHDPRVRVSKRDGLEGALALAPPPRARLLVLVDPSYEVKTEYAQVAAFLAALRDRHPAAEVLAWYPLLPAGLHAPLAEAGRSLFGADAVEEVTWRDPGQGRGLYGSGLIRAPGADCTTPPEERATRPPRRRRPVERT